MKAGDHILAMDDMYGGTYRYFTKVLPNMGVEYDLIDARDLDNVKNALKPNTAVSKPMSFFFLRSKFV